MDTGTAAWKRAALRAGVQGDLPLSVLQLLDAFGDAAEPRTSQLLADTQTDHGLDKPALPVTLPTSTDVEDALEGEVDPAQAAMFARRIAAVATALGSAQADVEVLLWALLCARLDQILSGPRPRALRVRALADFVYSQHARLALGGHGPSPEDLVDGLVWHSAQPGIDQARVVGATTMGPQRLHLLRLDPTLVRLRCVDRRDRARAGQDLAAHAIELGAVAACSGGFFLYSEPDIAPHSQATDPVGLLIDQGRVLSPPLFARSTLVERCSMWSIEALDLAGADLQIGDSTVAVDAAEPITRARALVSEQGGVAIVGNRVVAVAPPGSALEVPLNGMVLTLPRRGGLASLPQVGSTVVWTLRGVDAAMAAGPLLVRDGQPIADLAAAPQPAPQLVAEDFCGTAPPRTFSQDETGDRNLLPRLAAGLDSVGRLVLLAVDGRDLGGALGLSLQGTAHVMAALGCVSAMNLDGGSSKRLVLGDRVLDRPSTEILAASQDGPSPRRSVHTALFFLPR